jgi:hypothetical protein
VCISRGSMKRTVKQSETHETAPHLFVLTEEELILIQETEQEERSATQNTAESGHTFQSARSKASMSKPRKTVNG